MVCGYTSWLSVDKNKAHSINGLQTNYRILLPFLCIVEHSQRWLRQKPENDDHRIYGHCCRILFSSFLLKKTHSLNRDRHQIRLLVPGVLIIVCSHIITPVLLIYTLARDFTPCRTGSQLHVLPASVWR